MTRQWNESKNKLSKKRRVWVYEKSDLYKYGLLKEAFLVDLEHEHIFTQIDDRSGFSFEYVIVSNYNIVGRVPVEIIKDLQGKRNAS